MSYGQILKNGLKTLGFNETAVLDNANNESATGFGFLTLALAGVMASIIPIILTGFLGILALIFTPVMMIIGFIIGYSIFHFLAKMFGGKATGAQYFRSLSNVFVIYWLTFWIAYIPIAGNILSKILGAWIAAVNVYVLYKVHQLSIVKAIIIGLVIPIVVALILLGIGVWSLVSLM